MGTRFYRAIYPSNVTDHQSLSLTARIPKEGMLEVWYSAPPIRKRMGDRWLDICTMRSPQFHNGPNNRRPNQTTTTDPRCSGSSDFGVGILLSRLSGQPFVSVVTENTSVDNLFLVQANSISAGTETNHYPSHFKQANNGIFSVQIK